jgi:hypothetical protein
LYPTKFKELEKLKKLTGILVVLIAFSANFIFAQKDEHKDEKYEVKGKELSDGTLYGEDIDATQTVLKIGDIYADLEGYQKKFVVVEGDITQVCQNMGCWTMISDGKNEIRAQTLHKFFLPKDLKSVKAVVQGEFETLEITEEQAKHFAEESGQPNDNIKGPQKMYRVKASGIKILK